MMIHNPLELLVQKIQFLAKIVVKFVCCLLLILSQMALVYSYTVTFDLGSEGTLLSGDLVQTVPSGGTAIAPEFNVTDGLAFFGWDQSYANVSEDILVTAKYVDADLASILEQKVMASDRSIGDHFGDSVSVSGDTAIVGAFGDDINGSNSGSAYIFVRSGSIWVEQAKLTPSDGAAVDNFGNSVAISGDTALVGAFGDDINGSNSGSAYVFVRRSNIWTEQAKLIASDGQYEDRFGISVSLSGDTALIGADRDRDNGTNSGSAYVFVRDGNAWTEQAKLTPGDGAAWGYFGFSLSVSGNTALIGAHGDSDNGTDSGSAYVFVRSGNVWAEQTKLTAGDGTIEDRFGFSVSVSGDTALIGAQRNDDNGDNSGSAYVYVRSDSVWTEQAKLTPSDGAAYDYFGHAVSLHADTALIGNWSEFGSVYVYARTGDSWTEQAKLMPDDTTFGDYFGNSVSVNGDTAFVGVHYDDDRTGSGYIYDLAVPPATVTVTFDLDDKGIRSGGGELSQILELEGSATPPLVTAKPGWAFSGWDVDYNNVLGNVYVTALYSTAYTVTFDLGPEGTLLSGELIQSVPRGGAAIPPEFSVVEGKVFLGWYRRYDNIRNDTLVFAQYVDADLAAVLETKVLPNDIAVNDRFGTSVSVCGNTTIIGTSGPSFESNLGYVYVFVRNGDTWTEQAKLTPSNPADKWFFGGNVFLNGDTALVRAGYYYGDASSRSVYIYARNDSIWTEQAKLTSSDDFVNNTFGSSLSMSGDTAIIGASTDNSSFGSAYIYVRNGNLWNEQAKLTASDGANNDYFGRNVSVSGETALIGASDSAYVFVRNGGIWTEQTKLTSGEASDLYVSSVCLSGNTALIGAYRDDENGYNSGAAYIYVRNSDIWTQQAKLVPSDGATNDRFGSRVSLSGDIAVIGAYYDDDNGEDSGSAYVFVRNGDIWTEQTKLIASDGAAGDRYGSSLSLDGDTALIGAFLSDSEGENSGGAYFYDLAVPPVTVTFDLTVKGNRSGGGELIQSVKLGESAVAPLVTPSQGCMFAGWDVDFDNVSEDLTVKAQYTCIHHTVTFDLGLEGSLLSGDLVQSVIQGGTAIPPAIRVIEGMAFAGWDRDYSNVTQDILVTAQYLDADLAGILESKLIASDGAAQNYFGVSVSVSGDTALIGAVGDNLRGSAYVYVRNGDTWIEQAKLIASDVQSIYGFGKSVSVHGDTALIGSSNSAYVFVRSDGIWSQQAKLTSSVGVFGDGFGVGVSVSGDTALVGAYLDDDKGKNSGSAYVFERSGNTWTQQAKLTASDGASSDLFGENVSLSGDTALISAHLDDDNGNNSGSAYVFVRNNNIWTEQAKLTASDGITYDNFGFSVSMSGDTALIGTLDNSAYVFGRSGNIWTQQAELTTSDVGISDFFGVNVSLSGDTALIGSYSELNPSGSAYVYVRSDNTWTEQTKLTASNGVANERYGESVSVSGDTVLIGAYHDYDYGSAYIYDLAAPPVTVTFNLTEKGSRSGGGELVQTVKLGASAIAPLVATIPGYVFAGWDLDFDHVSEDITVTAQYTYIYPTVTFDLGPEGTLLSGDLVQSVIQGGTAIPPELRVADGVAFAGWDRDYADVTGDVFVTAQYLDADLAGIVENKITARDGSAIDYFGVNVSVCGDTALIGARGDNGDSRAYVYVRSGNTWIEQAKLIARYANSVNTNGAVALSGDTAVIGGTNATYVFVRNGSTWTEQAKLIPSDGGISELYRAISISGNTLIMGSYLDDGNGENSGSVYVFVRSGNTWTEQAKLTASDGASSDFFGESVSVSGNTALIGASLDDDNGENTGSAYVFVRSGNTWTEQAKLIANDGSSHANLGASVSVSGDTALIGTLDKSAYIYVRSGNTWTQQAKLNPSDSVVTDFFGVSVSLSGDTALINNYSELDLDGSAYVYVRNGDAWSEKTKLTASEDVPYYQRFGTSVSVSGDMAIIGAFQYYDYGSAYIYDLAAPPVTITFDLTEKGSRSVGGELIQTVKLGDNALAPTINPSPGWIFDGWNQPFSTVFEDINVTALYSSDPSDSDSDGDGLFDGWEARYFGDVSKDGLDDSDGDGLLDGDEFITGHSPIDVYDRFYISKQELDSTSGEITLSLATKDLSNRRYRIWYSEDLSASSWLELLSVTPFPSSPGDITRKTFPMPDHSGKIFFKVECFIEE